MISENRFETVETSESRYISRTGTMVIAQTRAEDEGIYRYARICQNSHPTLFFAATPIILISPSILISNTKLMGLKTSYISHKLFHFMNIDKLILNFRIWWNVDLKAKRVLIILINPNMGIKNEACHI